MGKTVTMLLCVLGALFLAWGLRAYYIASTDPAQAFLTASPVPERTAALSGFANAPSPSPSLSPEEQLLRNADKDFMQGRINILLVGFDESPERDEEGSEVYRTGKNNFRSDVLLLLAVDFQENRAHLISIPRDTYAPIYLTRGRWKINAAFAKGGAAGGDGFFYAMKTVEMLFGVPVNYYAGVNMAGLKALVDAMGGVDYDVDVAITLNGRTLATGYQHLNGQQVLDYCRARKGISTDLGRNDRQQRMLLAIFRQLKAEKKLSSLPALYAAVSGSLYTNLNLSQVAALSAFGLKLEEDRIKRTTLDGEYVHNVYNASYYVLRNKSLIRLVEEEFGVTIKRDKKYDLATVRRDKAAAEAKKAAESVEEIEALLTVPADTTGADVPSLYNRALVKANQLKQAIRTGVGEAEILRLRDQLNSIVARLLRENGVTDGLPGSFAGLVPGA